VFVGGGGGFVTGAVLKECKTAVVERYGGGAVRRMLEGVVVK
jgi:hypothetical protein